MYMCMYTCMYICICICTVYVYVYIYIYIYIPPTRYIRIFLRRIQRLQIFKIPVDVIRTLICKSRTIIIFLKTFGTASFIFLILYITLHVGELDELTEQLDLPPIPEPRIPFPRISNISIEDQKYFLQTYKQYVSGKEIDMEGINRLEVHVLYIL